MTGTYLKKKTFGLGKRMQATFHLQMMIKSILRARSLHISQSCTISWSLSVDRDINLKINS